MMEPSCNTPSVLGGSGVLGGLISYWAKGGGRRRGGNGVRVLRGWRWVGSS